MKNINFQKKHYDAAIRDNNPENAIIYFNKRIDLIENNKGFENVKKVLDIGCGDGGFLRHLRARYPELLYFGMDFSHIQLVHATKNNVPAHLIMANAGNIPFSNNCFDLILFNGVLHHLDDKERVIKEAVRVCRQNGKIIIIEPNRYNPLIFLLSLIKSHERGQLRLSQSRIIHILKEEVRSINIARINSLIYPCQKLPPKNTLKFFRKFEETPLFFKGIQSHFVIIAIK